MPTYDRLLSGFTIGSMTIPNRIIMPAMETHLADSKGYITDEIISYYRYRARGGVGLIIFENTGVAMSGRVNKGMACIHDDSYIPGFQKLCDAVHEEGGKIALQLSHAGRQTLSDFTGSDPLAPSAISCPVLREEPKELAVDEIHDLVESFAQSALRAQKAGADAVEFHMAHGYLVCQFLSPYSNIRSDMYGGSTENRCRFSVEIIARTRELVGQTFPIICRISADEYVDGGIDIDEAKKIAAILGACQIDALNVSACNYESAHLNMPCYYRPEGCFVHLSREIKRTVSLPVFAVGRIRRPQMAEDIISRGDADCVCMGRVLIADPFLPKKIADGRESHIRPCLSCNRCIESITRGKMVCVVNPYIGIEVDSEKKSAVEKKNICIVGAGPAGMQAALSLFQDGHSVTLFEKENDVGGQMAIAGLPPGKESILEFKDYLKREVEEAQIEVVLGKECQADDIVSRNPDVVVIATGSTHHFPPLPGLDTVKAYSVKDALCNPSEMGDRIVIIGGGPEGAELADFLVEKGKKVTIIEMRRLVGLGLPSGVRALLEPKIEEEGVTLLRKTKVVNFDQGSIEIYNRKLGTSHIRDFDSVVIAVHHESNNKLYLDLEGKVKELYLIGDAKEPRLIKEAVSEGNHVPFLVEQQKVGV